MQIPQSTHLLAKEQNGVPFYAFPSIDSLSCVAHGVSTRLGGVREGIFASMNLSFTRGDDPEKVMENFRRFCGAIGVPAERTVISRQTHTTNVRCVTEEDAGCGVVKERTYDDVDGLVTNVANLPLCTLYADCVPLFFADPVKKVVATSHSGWRGTVNQIGKETIKVMCDTYGCRVEDIRAGIGPSIGVCCFEVDQPVYDAFLTLPFFDEACGTPDGNGKYHIDLWVVNRRILLKAGIREENLSVTDVCTRCHPETLWSHRFTGPDRGSLAGIIMLKD